MQIPGLSELHRAGEDHWFAYELPVGLAVLVRLASEPILGQRAWLELLLSILLLVGAGWWAWHRERALLADEAPTDLLSLEFWQAQSVSTLLTFGLVAIVQRSALVSYGRWQPLPLVIGLWTGTYWLALGAAEGRARHVYLGLWLCAVAALLPTFSGALWRTLAAAVGLGGVMVLSGWLAGRKRT